MTKTQELSKLQKVELGLLAGFGIQLLLGMSLNLFVNVTTNHPGDNATNYFAGASHGLLWALSGSAPIALTLHAYLAVGLFLGCVSLMVRSLQLRSRRMAWASGIAAFVTLGALFNGLSFINYNHDISSMIMATCWLIAVGALVVGAILKPQLH